MKRDYEMWWLRLTQHKRFVRLRRTNPNFCFAKNFFYAPISRNCEEILIQEYSAMENNDLLIQFKKGLSEIPIDREIKYDITKYIKNFINKNQNDLDNNYELKEAIKAELFLFDFQYKPPKSIYSTDEKNNNIPLVPIFIDKDGNKYPNINTFSDKITEYFLRRFHEETNCYLKIIYSEYLLIKSNKSQIDRRLLFISLLNHLIELINIVFEKKSQFYELDISLYLSRLIEISCIKNILPKEEVFKVHKLIIKLFNDYLKNNNFRYILDILEYLISFELESILNIIFDDVITHYDKAISVFRENKQFNIARDYHEKIFKINKLLQKDNFDLHFKNGEEFEYEALNKVEEKNYLAAIYFFELAILQYQKVNPIPNEKIDSIDQIIKTHASNCQKEFKEISSGVKINYDEAYKEYVNYFVTNKDVEKNIEGYFFSEDVIFPNHASFISEFDKIIRNSFHSLFPQFILDSDRTIAKPSTEEENIEIQKISFYSLHFQVFSQSLFYLFFKLKELGVIDFDKIKQYVASVEYINSYHKSGIIKSIDAFIARDYFVCLHLAVPLFESILRHLLDTLGLRIKKYDKSKTDYLLLSELIKNEVWQENNLLSINYTFFLNYLLNERGGINIRNKIAHGFAREDELNEGLSIIVLHSLLHLVYKFVLNKT